MTQALNIAGACLAMLALGRLTPGGGLESLTTLPAAFFAITGMVFMCLAIWRALQ